MQDNKDGPPIPEGLKERLDFLREKQDVDIADQFLKFRELLFSRVYKLLLCFFVFAGIVVVAQGLGCLDLDYRITVTLLGTVAVSVISVFLSLTRSVFGLLPRRQKESQKAK